MNKKVQHAIRLLAVFMMAGIAALNIAGGINTYATQTKTAVKIIYASGETETFGPLSEADQEEQSQDTAEEAETALSEDSESLSGIADILESIPEDAEILITLFGPADGDTGVLAVYEKQESSEGNFSWQAVKEDIRTKYGKRGLYKEIEGDKKTPVGIFKMNTPFGIAEKLEGFPDNYITVDEGHYWNGDSDSEMYNKLVHTDTYTDFNTGSSEHLIDYTGYYDYCIDTGYNISGTPHLGSAIFLHCVVNDENTNGCIAIPKEDMIDIMRLYVEDKTYIAIFEE